MIEAVFGVGASEFWDPFAYAFGNGAAAAGVFVEIGDVSEVRTPGEEGFFEGVEHGLMGFALRKVGVFAGVVDAVKEAGLAFDEVVFEFPILGGESAGFEEGGNGASAG